jgi:hypothetical protein
MSWEQDWIIPPHETPGATVYLHAEDRHCKTSCVTLYSRRRENELTLYGSGLRQERPTLPHESTLSLTQKISVHWISVPRNGREQNFNGMSNFRKTILTTVRLKDFNHVSVDMPRRDDMGERVGSFVRQVGACLYRPDFGAVIISCNSIYWHRPVTNKVNLQYSVW